MKEEKEEVKEMDTAAKQAIMTWKMIHNFFEHHPIAQQMQRVNVEMGKLRAHGKWPVLIASFYLLFALFIEFIFE